MIRRLSASAALTIATIALAQTPGYHLIGIAPGNTSSGVTALSASGVHAAGMSYSGPGPFSFSPFIWSEASGRYDLSPADANTTNGVPYGISDNGAILAGTSGGSRAYRWTGPGTFQNLGTFSTFQFTAGNGLSGDGSIVVGRAWTNQPNVGQAWRWTQGTGYQGLGFTVPTHVYSEANAISRDGNVIVGMSQSSGGRTDAFRWTAAGGMQALPLLAGATSGWAYGTNHDGSIVAGLSGGIGVLWTGNTVQALTNPVGWTGAGATDVSDDGSVVIGSLNNATQIFVPHIWTPVGGWQTPATYFATQGFPVPEGWSIADVSSVSSDGRTFGGRLLLPGDTLGRAFVLTVPAPTSACALLLVVSAALRRRRQ